MSKFNTKRNGVISTLLNIIFYVPFKIKRLIFKQKGVALILGLFATRDLLATQTSDNGIAKKGTMELAKLIPLHITEKNIGNTHF